MNIKQLVTHVSCLSALVAAAACNHATPTGNLEVAFEIGSGVPCDNVQDVTIKLVKPGTKADASGVIEATAELTVDCSAGKGLLTSVEAGTYDVVVEGTDADNTVVVDNLLTADMDHAEVLENADTNVGHTIKLSPTPAKLEIRWKLEGFVNQCTQVPVKTFEVIGYKNAGKSPIAMGAFDCDAPSDLEMSYHSFLDPDRDLDGEELDSIEIIPHDATGNSVGDHVVYNITPPGAGKTVKLTFSTECTDTVCDLKCAADPCAQD
jgi:hypothetical protein